MKRRKMLLAIAVSIFMLLGFLPGVAVANSEDPISPGDFAFIPNSGEATVSRVDLGTGEAVARYRTQDPDEPDGAHSSSGDMYNWMTGRLVVDFDGNAWALNTTAYSDVPNLQGSMVRILAEGSESENTSQGHDDILDFGDDDRVTFWEIGEVGEVPRAVTVDNNGFIWVGFYNGRYFEKYDPDTGERLQTVDVGERMPYDAKVDSEGTLWFVSRNSGLPSWADHSGIQTGIFSFSTTDTDPEVDTYTGFSGNPYGIAVDADDNIWATNLGNTLFFLEKGTTAFESFSVSGASSLRGLVEDNDGNIWLASSGNDRAVKWDTSSNTSDWWSIGGQPCGVGLDSTGKVWFVNRNYFNPTGYITGIDPTDIDPNEFTYVDVGYRPYVYGNFTVPTPPTYSICGFKFLGDTDTGLAGWTITLEKLVEDGDMDDDDDWVFEASTQTGPDGKYCFSGLPAGIYRVSEEVEPGWTQTCPFFVDQKGGEWVHIVTLPGGETVLDPATEELAPLYNFCNVPELECFGDTAWASMHLPGQDRFVNPGNWATFLTIVLEDLVEEEMLSFPLYAGQYYLVGMLNVWVDEDGDIFVEYTTDVPQGIWDHYILKGGLEYEKEGYVGDWSHFTEFHLHVVDEFVDFNAVRTTVGRNRTPGGPIPGQFDYNAEYDCEDMMFHSDEIPIGNLDNFTGDFFFIAAHAVIQWCGYADDNGNGVNGTSSYDAAQFLGLIE